MNNRRSFRFLAGFIANLVLLSLLVNFANAADSDGTSLLANSDDKQGNGYSLYTSIFLDGLNASSSSRANNVVNGDMNRIDDVPLYARPSGLSMNISVASTEQLNDPDLPFSTFFGGASNDNEYFGDMTLDAEGNIYIVGYTSSSDFPTTPGALDISFNGGETSGVMSDAFVAKFSPNGKTLLFSTFLGGSNDDWANKVVVDASGNVYVVGRTQSSDFPITDGSYNQALNGPSDIFFTKIDSSGAELIYSTLLGGNSWDEGTGIVLDNQGDIYLTGYTYSDDFLTTPGGVIENCASYYYMPFVIKLQSDFQRVFSTCLGGDVFTTSKDIVVDSSGNPIVVGRAAGYDWSDVFVMKLSSTGDLIFYKQFGGNGSEEPYGASIDSSGNIFVTGQTSSINYPVTLGAFDETFNGSTDAFVTKIDSSGQTFLYSTYLGGTDPATGTESCYDIGEDIAVGLDDAAYVTGGTDCSFFPTTQNTFQPTNNGNRDAFAVVLDPKGKNLSYSTYVGGSSGQEVSRTIKVKNNGMFVIFGNTFSDNFPVTIDSKYPTYNGQSDIFLTALSLPNVNQPYSISGYVKDDLGDPKSGVLITLSDGQIINTNNEGFYKFFISDQIEYTIIPRLKSFRFAPKQATIDLTKKSNQDFIVRPETPDRFLELPVALPTISGWTPEEEFALALVGSNYGIRPGYVNTWFDHHFPNYGKDYEIKTWLGKSITYPPGPPEDPDINCQLGYSCYAGHNGIDFNHLYTNPDNNEPVYAATTGTVMNTTTNPLVTSCPNNDSTCGNKYGNQVWINHGNGYATFYGHLKPNSVNVTCTPTCTVITDRISQYLGIMGSTGNSTGTHLHFGLYYDQNGDGKWSSDEAVDPYGWNPVYDPGKTDPWNGVKSFYLWNSGYAQCTLTSSGTTQKSATGMLTMQIPAGAVSTNVTLEILDTPPVAESIYNLRFTGQNFLTQVLEWLAGSSSLNSKGVQSTAETEFAQPVSMIVNYDPNQLIHLDLTNLALYLWNDLTNTWVALSSTIDSVNHTVTAQTTSVGNVSLQAPLICPADHLEPNDNYDGAILVQTNGKQTNRLFDIAQDEDWFKFDALTGAQYSMQTTNLATGVDTALEIYDTDGVTLLATDDNSGGGKASSLTWQAHQDGVYYARIVQASGSSFGCNASYDFDIEGTYSNYLPLVSR